MINVFLARLLGLDPPFNIYSTGGIIWVMGLFFTPYMYLFSIGSLRKMDPSLEESARISGCGVLGTTMRITLPLATPGILFGFSLTFITSFGFFGVPAVLGMPAKIEVLATLIYETLEVDMPDYNMAATYGMIMLGMTLIAVVVQRKVILPRQFTTVTGKGYRPASIDLGRWRYVAFAYNLFYLMMAVVLPLLALVLVSISRNWYGYFDPGMFTLDNFRWVLFEFPLTRRAIANSFFLATVGATLLVVLTFVVAHIIHRSEAAGRGALDLLVTFPIGVPGIIIAMGVLVAYIRTPLYGTIWILMLGYATRFLPVGLKNVSAVLLSIGPELEESARVSGASWLRTAWSVSVPLMKSGLVAGWLLLLLIFMRELNTSILLFSPGNEVISVALYTMVENNSPVQLAAFAVIQTILLLIVVSFARIVTEVKEVTV
jgi:iron(III) transport system permease protein